MASSDKEVRVPIGIPVETNAAEAADSVDALSDSIAKSKDIIRDAATNLRGLRGSSEAVKAAKDQLKATIDREKASVSESTLRLIKQGTTADRVAAQTKKLAAQQAELKKKAADAIKADQAERVKNFGTAMGRVGGPMNTLIDRLKSLKELAGQAAGSGGLGLVSLAAAGLTAIAVAAAVAVGTLVYKLATWAIRGADVARSMQLVREASTASGLSASNLGEQIAALSKKVPTSTAALNQLGASLARSRLGGQQTVDLLNAVAQANAALGDETLGSKMKELVERGRMSQRMFIGLQELQGTGLDFTDVAEALAKSTKVGVAQARKALLEGRVKLGDGAKALRDAVEKKFAGINMRKMFTLEGLSSTFEKMLGGLTSGLTPAFEKAGSAVFKMMQAFDESTATGQVLKRAVTAFGNGIAVVIEKGAPIVKEFLRGMIIAGLEIYIGYLRVKNALKGAFGDATLFKNIDWLNVALETGKTVLYTFVAGLLLTAAAAAVVLAPFVYIGSVIYRLVEQIPKAAKEISDFFSGIDWAKTGGAIVDGLIGGIRNGFTKAVDTVKELGTTIQKTFVDAFKIHSPSELMADLGKQLPAGVAQGVTAGAPQAQQAVDGMVDASGMSGGGAPGLGKGGTSITIGSITLIVQSNGETPKDQVEDPGLLAAVTKLFKDAAGGAGFGVA